MDLSKSKSDENTSFSIDDVQSPSAKSMTLTQDDEEEVEERKDQSADKSMDVSSKFFAANFNRGIYSITS